MRQKFTMPAKVAPALRVAAARTLRGFRAAAAGAWLVARAPGTWIVAMLAAGGACAVLGVLLLAGPAWALIAAAAILFSLAALALRGAAHG